MSKETIELPLYNCHKQVHAARITGIAPADAEGVTEIVLNVGGRYFADAVWRNRHDPKVGDYLVIYKDGYVSVSPAAPFEEGYAPAIGDDEKVSPTVDVSFGEAINALKLGKRVARAGWNGKGMYLWLLPAAMVKAEWCREQHLKAVAEGNGGEIECLGSIRMMTADKKVLTGWLASQTDVLATDWVVLD